MCVAYDYLHILVQSLDLWTIEIKRNANETVNRSLLKRELLLVVKLLAITQHERNFNYIELIVFVSRVNVNTNTKYTDTHKTQITTQRTLILVPSIATGTSVHGHDWRNSNE